MKASRQQKILEIIQNNEICTQESLLEKLHEAGFAVTQATVSRDIKRLNLMKRITPEGRYAYTAEQPKQAEPLGGRFRAVFGEAVVSVDYAMNTAVIKCHSGMGNAVCAALDQMEWDSVVGTLAGDDTIFVLLRTEQKAYEYTRRIQELLNGE